MVKSLKECKERREAPNAPQREKRRHPPPPEDDGTASSAKAVDDGDGDPHDEGIYL